MLNILLPAFFLVASHASAQAVDDPTQMEEFRKRLHRVVKPTADQEVQLDQIFRTHKQATENWRRENGEILRAARGLQEDAVRANDRGTLQAVGKEIRELMESRRALLQTMMNQLEDVLDEKQLAQARELLQPARAGPDVLRRLPQLHLVEAQKAEVQTILEQAATRARATKDRAARDEIMDEAVADIRQTVLSRAQRDALEQRLREAKDQSRRREMLRKMDFTDEQKAKIKSILAEARQQAETAKTPREKQAILAVAHRTIRRDVWTRKQRDQFFLSLLEKQRRRMAGLGMTEEQVVRAEQILADAHDKAQAADNDDEKRQLLREAFETIRRTVLKAETRERMK